MSSGVRLRLIAEERGWQLVDSRNKIKMSTVELTGWELNHLIDNEHHSMSNSGPQAH